MRLVSGIQYYVNFLLIALVVIASTSQAQAQKTASERVITLSATGSVKAKPDTAHISTAVETVNKSAQLAVKENSEIMTKVIEALKKRGIKSDDIQTADFSVQPEYEGYNSTTKKKPEIIGYRVTNNIRITVDKIDELGEILDEVVQLGANRIGGISFSVKKSAKLLDQARRQAMKTAIKRAWLYTSAAGARLGRVINISESNGFTPAPQFANMRSFKAAAPVPVETGTQELTVRVNVSWQIVR